MIFTENLTYTVEDTGREILSGITLSICKGERIGLIGQSGSGKTTLGFLLAGIHKKAVAGNAKGTLSLNGTDCIENDYPGFAGIVLQNPETQIFCETPEEEIYLGLENTPLSEEEKNQIVDDLLGYFGLNDVRSKNISKLSVGMKQRISIASMLAINPDLLLLDEPTNYLDNETSDKLFDHLNTLNGLTTIIIEHDIARLTKWADRIYELEDGKLTRVYNKKDFDSIHKFDDTIKPPHVKTSTEEMLKLNDVTFSYNGNGTIFSGMNHAFRKGEIIAVTGKNGSGKSTLLKLIKGIIKPDMGTINLNGGNGIKLMEQVAFSFQNPDEQIFAATVKDECEYWLKNRNDGNGRSEISARYLTRFGLDDKTDMLPFVLSYGEKRRLALASVLVVDPDVICLDEPTVALDNQNLTKLARYFNELAQAGKTIIFSTHDFKFARAAASRVIDLDQYNMAQSGNNKTHSS